MAAVDEIAALAEAVGKDDFHPFRFRVRHRVQVRVQARNETLAAALDHPGGFNALLVIPKPLLDREAGQADVVPGSAVPLGIAQVDDVDGVVALQTGSTSSAATSTS